MTEAKARFIILNERGMHARAASQLVKLAAKYPCDIRLSGPEEQAVSAKSVMGVLLLCGAKGTAVAAKDIKCMGEEQNLVGCEFSEPDARCLSHNHDTVVRCTNADTPWNMPEGTLRLRDNMDGPPRDGVRERWGGELLMKKLRVMETPFLGNGREIMWPFPAPFFCRLGVWFV